MCATQLHRHDLPWDCPINKEINKINHELKKIKRLNLLNIRDFKRHFFSGQGQHLNKLGKQVLSRRIVDLVIKKQFKERQSTLEAQTMIKVVEVYMEMLMNLYKNDSELAFAHCISRDFENDVKHMIQGLRRSNHFQEAFWKTASF